MNGIVFTGSLKSGKSYLAERTGLDIVELATPIHNLAAYYGSKDKSKPGVRRLMQQIGAYGRGIISEQYPMKPWRAALVYQIRENGLHMTRPALCQTLRDARERDVMRSRYDLMHAKRLERLWSQFGQREDFWVEHLKIRLTYHDGPAVMPNGRFPNEVNTLVNELGYKHYHVMCSEKTRRERLGGEYDPEAEADITEQLAQELNALAGHKTANEDKVIHPPVELAEDLTPQVFDGVWSGSHVIWCDEKREMPGDFVHFKSFLERDLAPAA